jgi:hypothetical protein
MKLTKEEIAEELIHQTQVVKALHARRRVLEIQAAQHGAQTSPQILTELTTLTEEIRRHQDEISQLEMLAAEDQIPLAEAEYRVLLADIWDTPQGRPTVAGAARLELTRLRLGLAPDRAKQIENEIRSELADEILFDIDTNLLEHLYGKQNIKDVAYTDEDKTNLLRSIGRAIRFAPLTAVTIVLASLEPRNPNRYINPNFITDLITVNKVRDDLLEADLFQEFWTKLNEPMAAFDPDELELLS